MIGACGLSDDDDGKNDGLKWKLEESVRQQNKIKKSTIVIVKIHEQVEGFRSVQIIDPDEGGPKSNLNTMTMMPLLYLMMMPIYEQVPLGKRLASYKILWSVLKLRRLSLLDTSITPIQNNKMLTANSFTFSSVQLDSSVISEADKNMQLTFFKPTKTGINGNKYTFCVLSNHQSPPHQKKS